MQQNKSQLDRGLWTSFTFSWSLKSSLGSGFGLGNGHPLVPILIAPFVKSYVYKFCVMKRRPLP